MGTAKHVTIAGAGLVGSLLAVMLGQRGYRVTVYEKRPDMRSTKMAAGRSINLALAERGIYALRQAELYDQVARLLIPMRGRMLHSADGRLEFLPYGQREHEVIYSVSRGALNRLLMSEAESHPQVEIHFECECESIDWSAQQMTLTDLALGKRSQVSWEVLIGADGAGSKIREAILETESGECDIDMLEHDYKELSIPPGEDGHFQMEREALHIWPRGGFMLIALPNLDASYTVTLFLPSQGDPSFEQLRDAESVSAFFSKYAPDARELIANLTSEFFDNPTGQLGTVRCWPWSTSGKGLILGDAAHAIVPFHGQGMNAGFEDCTTLTRLLDATDDDWPRAMREFQSIRKRNTDAIAQMALDNYVTMRDSVADQDFQLKKRIGFELEKRWPDRFIPQYSMVMFHRIPYAVAFQRGKIQRRLLEQLVAGISTIDEVDWDQADRMVAEELEPFESTSNVT